MTTYVTCFRRGVRMKCLEDRYSYRGALVSVVVYTSSSTICSEVREAISGGVSRVLDFIRRHGGCYIESENPLRASSGDNTVTVEIKPLNVIARMFWSAAVNKAREVCSE
ncbi:MAG: hypothetical protein QXI85_03895 [Desulfurococcaceae archaeon]